ncbi:MAG: hypothetical protein GF383_05810 [Candidatus Lokiarchaeota archaeon]|nr:hypothetical protein [Candidatus Lokiarchaeota archaeon]MBD3339447.1 hypothetical protein [Candidatus Lokiarchaeota archaeon]
MSLQNDYFSKDNLRYKEDKNICCDSPKISDVEGFHTCLNCGFIHERVLDFSPKRMYTKEDVIKNKTNERVYLPIGPRTVIRGNRDCRGSLLNAKNKHMFRRLSKIQRSLTNSYERNLWIALPNLQRLQKLLKLPNHVAEDSLRIYTRTVKKHLTMGRSIENLLAASIYAALKIHAIPLTLDELADATQIPQEKIIKNYKLIHFQILPTMNLKVKHLTAIDYIDKFIDQLKLSMKVRNDAIKIITGAKKNGFNPGGKDPKGIISAAIYLSSKINTEPRTQKEITDITNVTQVTLRGRVKELNKYTALN